MWIHLQSHFNKLRQGQTGSDQTIVSGILEARQRHKQYRAGVRAGSNTIGVPESNITRAGSRESTEVNRPGSIKRYINASFIHSFIHSFIRRSQNTAITLRMSAGAKTRLRSECVKAA